MIKEIIGRKVKIVESHNPSAIGMSGTVVDDTRSMLVIENHQGERKRLVKSQHRFELEGQTVDGSLLEGRPEERIKRWIRGK